MTQPHLVCVLNNDHLMELLEATLPDGPGTGAVPLMTPPPLPTTMDDRSSPPANLVPGMVSCFQLLLRQR